MSVKIISLSPFFRFIHFSVAKMLFVQGAGAIVQVAKYVLFYKIKPLNLFIFI